MRAPLFFAGILCVGSMAVPERAAYAQAYAAAFANQSLFFENWLGALKITASQVNVSSQQVSTTISKSLEAAADANAAGKENSIQVGRDAEDHGDVSGQPYKSCLVAPGIASIGSAVAQKNTYQQTTGNRDNQWFEDGGNQSDSLSSQIGLRKTIYCSQSEQTETGAWCNQAVGKTKSGSIPAGNSNAGVWLLSRGYGGEEGMAGMDYTDTIAPLPSVPAMSSDQNATSPTSAIVAQQRAAAIYSGAFMTAARAGIQRAVLEGMQDTSLNQASEDDTWAANP